MKIQTLIIATILFDTALAGDQNESSDNFIKFTQSEDLLIMHMAVSENIKGVGKKLHTPPGVIGKIASESGTNNLVLSHIMALCLKSLNSNMDQVRSGYSGPVSVTRDLECITL